MTKPENCTKVVLIVLTIALSPFLFCCCLPVSCDQYYTFQESRITRGMTAEQVKAILGEPDIIYPDPRTPHVFWAWLNRGFFYNSYNFNVEFQWGRVESTSRMDTGR